MKGIHYLNRPIDGLSLSYNVICSIDNTPQPIKESPKLRDCSIVNNYIHPVIHLLFLSLLFILRGTCLTTWYHRYQPIPSYQCGRYGSCKSESYRTHLHDLRVDKTLIDTATEQTAIALLQKGKHAWSDYVTGQFLKLKIIQI